MIRPVRIRIWAKTARCNIFCRGVNHWLEISGNPCKKSKSRTPEPEISLKIQKSRTLNVEVIYPSHSAVCNVMSVKINQFCFFTTKLWSKNRSTLFSQYTLFSRCQKKSWLGPKTSLLFSGVYPVYVQPHPQVVNKQRILFILCKKTDYSADVVFAQW